MYITLLFYTANITYLCSVCLSRMVVHVNHEDIKSLIVLFNNFCLTVHLNLTLPSPCEVMSMVFCLTWFNFSEVCFQGSNSICLPMAEDSYNVLKQCRTVHSICSRLWEMYPLYSPHIEDNCFHCLSLSQIIFGFIPNPALNSVLFCWRLSMVQLSWKNWSHRL